VLGLRSAANEAWLVAGAADDPRREPVAPEMAQAIERELMAAREPLT
jgi:hypothetical protein